ncbi:MAG: alpha/beta hydrolase family protein [Microthrixaceae bacterium]
MTAAATRGRSRRESLTTWPRTPATLARIIDWSGAGRVVVVGHSLGGTIGAALAVVGDDRVVALAAFESPFPALDDSFDQIGAGAVQLAGEVGFEAAAEHFYRLMVGEATWSRVRERDRAARRAEGPALIAELADLRRRDHAIDPPRAGASPPGRPWLDEQRQDEGRRRTAGCCCTGGGVGRDRRGRAWRAPDPPGRVRPLLHGCGRIGSEPGRGSAGALTSRTWLH